MNIVKLNFFLNFFEFLELDTRCSFLLFLFLVVLFLLTFDVDVSSCFFLSFTSIPAAHHIVLLSMICVDVYFPKIWNYVRYVINY